MPSNYDDALLRHLELMDRKREMFDEGAPIPEIGSVDRDMASNAADYINSAGARNSRLLRGAAYGAVSGAGLSLLLSSLFRALPPGGLGRALGLGGRNRATNLLEVLNGMAKSPKMPLPVDDGVRMLRSAGAASLVGAGIGGVLHNASAGLAKPYRASDSDRRNTKAMERGLEAPEIHKIPEPLPMDSAIGAAKAMGVGAGLGAGLGGAIAINRLGLIRSLMRSAPQYAAKSILPSAAMRFLSRSMVAPAAIGAGAGWALYNRDGKVRQ